MRYYVEAAEIGTDIKSRDYYNSNNQEHVEQRLKIVADSYNKRTAAEHLEIVPKMRKKNCKYRFEKFHHGAVENTVNSPKHQSDAN